MFHTIISPAFSGGGETQEAVRSMKDGFTTLFQRKKMVLIMSLPENNPEWCRAAFENGADAVKGHINVHHRASGTHFGRWSEERAKLEAMLEPDLGPVGLVLGGSLENASLDAEEVRACPFAFCSVYAHHLPAWALDIHPLMAACDNGYTPEEIRAMPGMGVDVLEASVIPGDEYGQGLSLRDLMRYRSIADTVSLPVVVPTQRAIQPREVPALIRAGVRGLMIGAVVTGRGTESIARAVATFREAIDGV